MKTKKRRNLTLPLPDCGTVTLVDLCGVNGETKAYTPRSVTEATKFIRAGKPVTQAGDNGAVIVWLVEGRWHCEFCRRLATVDHHEFKHIAAVAQWLKEWWPEMRYSR